MQLPPISDDGHLPKGDPIDEPRRSRGRPKASSSPAPRASSSVRFDADDKIREGLTRYYSLPALLFMRADPTGYDVGVIGAMAEKCADGWVSVGHENPEVYKVLKLITAQNAYMDIILPHVAIVVGLAANHGILPVGTVQFFDLPIPNRVAAEAAVAPMGQQTAYIPPIPPQSPLDIPVMPQNPPRMDASSTGVGAEPVPGMQTVQFPDSLMETIKAQALQQALANRTQAMAQQQQAVTGMPGYNASDTAPRTNQNPQILQRLMQRR